MSPVKTRWRCRSTNTICWVPPEPNEVYTSSRVKVIDAAVNAAKSELKIKSPSRVFEEEVGVMAMKGLGQGVLKESKEQAKIVRNAARYLTGEAKAGSIMTTSNDNRRTYNQQSSISFAGSNFYINDRQDAYALAVEIASLTRRQQRGKGLRMA